MLLAIANRPIDTNTTYTVGGDVSRFQRSSVPAARPPAPADGQLAAAPARGGAGARAVAHRPGGPRRSRQQCHGRSGGSSLR